ncbi:hypothetical protein ACLX1H_010139 [Fusarium chlamydosporum]
MAAAPDSLASSMAGLGISAPFTLSGSDSSSSVDDDAPLPFPEALPRADFLAEDFQPAAYLSALPHRHQTLEDLRSDLRDRSAAISSELLELVNSNYTAFLSLGSELRGGDDKVEDVKVSLLGFRRAVEEVKTKVTERKEETNTLNGELRGVRSAIEKGRKMMELSERLASLEERLSLDSLPADQDWDEESEDDEDDNYGSSPAKLLASAQECSRITKLLESLNPDTPYVIKMEERLTHLGNALKEAKKAGVKGQDRVLKCLAIYRVLDAQSEAIKALRGG